MLAGYSGPPPLTPLRVFTAWQPNPAGFGAALLGAAYWVAVSRLRGRGGAWPTARCWSFLAGGVGWLIVITCGSLGVYSGVLFWARAAQNVSLLMVVPMFLAMGAPLTLLREFIPTPARATLGRALRSATARRLTFPLVVTVVFVAPLPLVYLTPIYPASLEHGWVGALVGLGLLLCGWVYFWTRFRFDPTPRSDPFIVSLGISAAEVLLDGMLGLVVWLGPLLAAHYYLALARPWGPSLRMDQAIGAGVLWVGGDLAGLPFLGVVLRRMTGEDAEHAALVDAELDRQEAEAKAAQQAATAGAPPPAAQTPGEPAGGDRGGRGAAEAGRSRLWWEDYPELAERFRRR